MKTLVCDDCYKVGEIFREARIAAGISMHQVEELIGIAESTVSQIERGSHLPRLVTLLTYAKILGFDEVKLKVPENI